MYRPVYLLMLSSVLVMTQPVSMLVIGSWICGGQFSADIITNMTTAPVSCNTTGCYNSTDFVGQYEKNGTFSNPAAVAYPSQDFWNDGCSTNMHNFFFDGGDTSIPAWEVDTNALVPNTTIGWCIQIFGTYLGFATMFVGVCQATMLHIKIAKKWSEIRGN